MGFSFAPVSTTFYRASSRIRELCARSSIWIERLTTDQEVGGSSPSGRALKPLHCKGFRMRGVPRPSDVWERFADTTTSIRPITLARDPLLEVPIGGGA